MRRGIPLLLALAACVLLASQAAWGATGEVGASWEPGSPNSFSDLECPNPRSQLRVVSSPVREGAHALRVSVTPRDVWSNGTVRCLLADYGSGETVGDDFLYELSLYIPPPGISENLIWELHQPQALYDLPDCGLAPFALHTDGRRLLFRIATGDCTPGRGMSYFAPNIVIPGLDPYPRGAWIDLRIRIRFAEARNGIVEVWSRRAGQAWPPQPAVVRKGIPTMPFASSAGVHDVTLYTELGLYPPAKDSAPSDAIYLDAYRRTSVPADHGRTLAPLVGIGLAAALAGLAVWWVRRRRAGRASVSVTRRPSDR
jgi:hypothetical protein